MDRQEAEELFEDTLREYGQEVELEDHWKEAILMILQKDYIDQKAPIEIILDALNWGNGVPLRLKLELQFTQNMS